MLTVRASRASTVLFLKYNSVDRVGRKKILYGAPVSLKVDRLCLINVFLGFLGGGGDKEGLIYS